METRINNVSNVTAEKVIGTAANSATVQKGVGRVMNSAFVQNGVAALGNRVDHVVDAVKAECYKLRDSVSEANSGANEGSVALREMNAVARFLDPAYWAEEHPEMVKPVSVAALTAASMACPALIGLTTVVGILPDEIVSIGFKYSNYPCPPYLIRKAIEKKLKKSQAACDDATYSLHMENPGNPMPCAM